MGILNRILGNDEINKTVVVNQAVSDTKPQVEELLKALSAKGENYNGVLGTLDMNGWDYGDVQTGSKNTEETNIQQILNHKRLLRQFSDTIIVQSILRTRKNQVVPYLRPARYSNTGLGYSVKRKDGELISTPQEKHRINDIEDFIQHTGKNSYTQRDTFVEFVKKLVDELYIYDQVNTEFVTDKSKKLDHFNILDGGTILVKTIPSKIDKPRVFAQYDRAGREIATFSEEELSFYINNPTTTIDHKGYGKSAVESAMSHLKYYTDTEQFNARFFSQGGTTKGILLIDYGETAQATQSSLHALRQQWQAQFSGNNGAWKIPVLTGKDAKFVNMSQSSKDMEFEAWLNYLINIVCSAFTINPEEINFPNRGGSTGRTGGNSINEGSTMKSKMDNSKQKGLQPLLQAIEDYMNRFIMPKINNNYFFQFTLGDTVSEKEQMEILKLKLDNGMLINEARKQMGLAPIGADGNVYGSAGQAINLLTMKESLAQTQGNISVSDDDKDKDSKDTPDSTENGSQEQPEPDNAVADDGKGVSRVGSNQKALQKKNVGKNLVKQKQKGK